MHACKRHTRVFIEFGFQYTSHTTAHIYKHQVHGKPYKYTYMHVTYMFQTKQIHMYVYNMSIVIHCGYSQIISTQKNNYKKRYAIL